MKSMTAKGAGRHRAPSKVQRNIKIIGVAVPVLALLGTFVAYRAQPSRPDPVSGSQAAYHLRTPVTGRSASAGTSDKSSKSGKTSKTARSRHAVRARSPHRSDSTAKPAAAPAPSPQASHGTTKSQRPSGGGSANLKAAVQEDIANGNYLLALAQYLVENGYSDAAAAGVASCVDGESGGNPESVGSGGGGLIGWTPISSAAPNPNIITGNAAQDMMDQLSDILYYNSTEIGQPLVNQLDSISDPVAAADFFSQNFEKPAVTDGDVVASVAEQIFSELS
jgi:hypothetical protein